MYLRILWEKITVLVWPSDSGQRCGQLVVSGWTWPQHHPSIACHPPPWSLMSHTPFPMWSGPGAVVSASSDHSLPVVTSIHWPTPDTLAAATWSFPGRPWSVTCQNMTTEVTCWGEAGYIVALCPCKKETSSQGADQRIDLIRCHCPVLKYKQVSRRPVNFHRWPVLVRSKRPIHSHARQPRDSQTDASPHLKEPRTENRLNTITLPPYLGFYHAFKGLIHYMNKNDNVMIKAEMSEYEITATL